MWQGSVASMGSSMAPPQEPASSSMPTCAGSTLSALHVESMSKVLVWAKPATQVLLGVHAAAHKPQAAAPGPDTLTSDLEREVNVMLDRM